MTRYIENNINIVSPNKFIMKNIFHDQSSDTYHVSEILVYLVKLPTLILEVRVLD